MLAKGDGAGDVRVPAPATWVCSELAFRRALRWVESPEYGRRSLLHDSIVAGLAVSTCHDSRRGRLRALRGTVPGPRSHCIPMCRAPGPHRPRHVPFGEQIGNGVPCVARRRGVASMPTVFVLLFPHPGATHPFASERARTCDASGAAGLCTCHEGRGPGLRYLVRHEAGPCESHGKC